MAAYQKYATAFQKMGLFEDALASQSEIKRALDGLANKNARTSRYDDDVASQLWDETPKQTGNNVYVRDYLETLVKAESILSNDMQRLEKQIQRASNQSEKRQKLEELADLTRDYQVVTLPFGLQTGRESTLLDASHISASRRSGVSNASAIFTKTSGRSGGSSVDLKFVMMFTLIGLLVECLVMFHKHHFFSLLALLAVLAIFFLNYFDQSYMRFVLVNLIVSIVLDVVWLIFHAGSYWSPRAETQHSLLQKVYLKFVIFFILGLMFLRFIIGAILFKYRSNPPNISKQLTFFGATFPLSGTPDSPIANIATGGQSQASY